MNYNHKQIEGKWQEEWMSKKIYAFDPKADDPYYLLVELTYTSGDLHMGHWFAWTAPDAFARMKRMQGKNVLFPVGGFDAFGLPAENAAIKHGIHPKDWTYKNIENMRNQFIKMGPSFDWEKEVITSDPQYFRWTQWLFLQLLKNGLAYRDKVWSNWCPECKTVLANEHVENGCCWRHNTTPVEQKQVDQWLVRITDYADKLIWPEQGNIDWPEAAKEGQNNWIGRKEGITISYQIEGQKEKVDCWTSRPDTNFGATFIVIAPEHALVQKILNSEIETSEVIGKDIERYVEEAKNKLERERLTEAKKKTGVFTGLYAINMLNNKKLPIWISDFVISSFGTGAVVGVPAHDQRDFEFARTFDLPVVRVVVGSDGDTGQITKLEQVQENEGKMINSELLDGMDIHQATVKMMDYLEDKGWGKRKVNYHLRDWSVSRQRYWAAPVPMIYCESCAKKKKSWFTQQSDEKLRTDWDHYGWFPVSEDSLPITLPENVDYMPTGKPPLATAEEWVRVKCPNCGLDAKREVETLDTYVDSSWYFFRYPSPNYDKGPFDKKIIDKCMPIDLYFGGPEHILGHTLYARFITKFLHDLGYVKFDEFAKKRVHHGVIQGSDGYRMSKSRGNVVNPDEQVEKFGADSVRLYISFLGPHGKGGAWKTEGIEGTCRFINRVWRLISENRSLSLDGEEKTSVLKVTHKTIQKVTKDIEEQQTNTAIAALMEFSNFLEEVVANKKEKQNPKGESESSDEWFEALKILVQLLAPFAPHVAEEIWVEVLKLPFSVHKSKWPNFNPELMVEKEVTMVVQVAGKLRGTLRIPSDSAGDKSRVIELAKQQENVSKWLEGVDIKKEVFVPGKLVNFVLK